MSADPFVGRTLGGKYTLVRRLGAGGMGAVYEAIQLDLERAVAVKIVTERSIDEKSVGRLRQEAIAAARLAHPNVVEIFDFGTDEDGHPFIVMEQLVGSSLHEVIARGRLSIERAVRIAMQMLDALGTAHRAGIIHRDVKPANVMLLEDDRVKVVDFGIARLADHERDVRTTTGTLLGTPAYLAPEQIDGRNVDGRADLHAVGLCLFEMLLAGRPWRGSIADLAIAVLREVPPSVDSRRDDVPPALARVIARSLSKDPGERFATAEEMNAALAASLRRSLPAPVVTAPPRRSWPLLASISAGALALTAFGLGLARTRPAPPSPPQTPPVSAPTAEPAPAKENDAAPIESAPPLAPSSARAAPAHPANEELVLCADPVPRYGFLCATSHPTCYCVRGDAEHRYSCALPMVDNQCPATASDEHLLGVKNGAPCPLYFLDTLADGGNRVVRGLGEASCSYCSMGDWWLEPRRGVIGGACTGYNARGVLKPGKWVRRAK